MMDFTVITRNNRTEKFNVEKIRTRLDYLISKNPAIPSVSSSALIDEIVRGLATGISTTEIDEYAANAAASLAVDAPYYLKLAGRIAVSNHQKNTSNTFIDKMRSAYENTENMIRNPLISDEMFAWIEDSHDYIQEIIDYSRDYLMDFFGFRTFQRSFSIKVKDVPIERPQDMYMRTAIALHANFGHPVTNEVLECIRETYELLSLRYYTHASPTYYNAGTRNPQFASCFLLGTQDSRAAIMKTADDISTISKWAGGIGLHVNSWRSTGSRIRSTNGKSSGIIPWLKIYQETLCGFNQGGRRSGSAAIYIMPHHPDIMKFIEAGRNSGVDELRARKLFYAVWLPDIFMERLRADALWSTFDPDTTEDLSNYSCEEYRAKYLELEAAGKYTSQIPTRDIWNAIYESNKEVGHPYICFADNANRQSQQSNLGTIKSSNLCAEIYLHSDEKEYAVCILSSIALPAFVEESDGTSAEFPTNGKFNFDKLRVVTKTIVRNLNAIIDRTFNPVAESALGNIRHRPIGVGVQGLDDAYAKMRYPFASDDASDLNKKIFETMYYAALCESCELSRKKYLAARAIARERGEVSVPTWDVDATTPRNVSYTLETLPTNAFAYPSAHWNGGSPISRGVFHWELSGLTQDKLSQMYDWESLREKIKKFGVVNSVLIACMPTASTSQLLGNNECIEPYTSNIYKRQTNAGEFVVMKKYLMNDLHKINSYNVNVKNYLLASGGSVQYIDGLPQELKDLYKTVWEIDPSVLVQQAIERQPFVDQGQSLNLWMTAASRGKFTSLMGQAWRGGLKTGKYYLRTRPATTPQKFTIDPHLQEAMASVNVPMCAVEQPSMPVCDSCSG